MTSLSFALYHDHGNADIINVMDSFTMVIGALCQQYTCVKMKYLSTRIIYFFTLLFCLLIYNYYSACVVSARLDEPVYKINDSLLQMVKIPMKMASERMVYLEYFLKSPIWEIREFYHNYWLKLPKSERFMEPENGMALVQKGGFAYHIHPDVAYTLIEKSYINREICELMEVHLSRPQNTMFGVNNNCTYAELVRVGLTKISEVGLRRRQLIKWQYRKPRCRRDILSASSVDIYEFAPHLILLLFGLLLAMFMCIFETHGNRGKIKLWQKMYLKKRRTIL
ncbi:ionotropic receptor 75a-like [Phymastichus coffea]|uniref:ionotropic receptor 75a-like n=1 Tax=Phymastichus coffea TaxID=108790 RepID=UPI00273C63F6|nr:ionotropic receptor 75a-like [Phymastichus coffea]